MLWVFQVLTSFSVLHSPGQLQLTSDNEVLNTLQMEILLLKVPVVISGKQSPAFVLSPSLDSTQGSQHREFVLTSALASVPHCAAQAILLVLI